MVFTTPFTDQHEILLDKMVDLITENALFYVIYQDSDTFQTKYKQAITIRTADFGVTNSIKLNNFTGSIIENYDLKGLKIWSNTLPWAPFFTIENCNSEGKNCDHYGFYHDFMEGMGKLSNFTFESHADPDGNWGVRPSSGPFNKSGIWGGSMGSVVNGDYMISLSQWVWTVNRYGLLDFVSTSSDSFYLVLTPKPAEVDFGLFIRCFTDDAWTGCAVVLIIALCIIIIPYAFLDYYEYTDGQMIASTSTWFFFVLLNAFYGGALTMFFVSEIPVPFISVEDVMKAYPSWKLKMMNGNDVHFQYKAIQGDPLFAAFWDRVQNKPEETVFQNIEEGLDLLEEEQAVMHCSEGMLKGYFQANPFRQQTLKTFAKGRATFYALIVPINSPLKPILQKASNTLLEAGTMDYLVKVWEGLDIPDLGAVEIMVLTAGQVVLIFFIIIAWFGMAICVFGCELVHKRVKDSRDHEDPIRNLVFGKKAEEAKASLRKGVKPLTTTSTTTSEDVVLQYPDISKWKKEFFEPKIDPGQPAIYNS